MYEQYYAIKPNARLAELLSIGAALTALAENLGCLDECN